MTDQGPGGPNSRGSAAPSSNGGPQGLKVAGGAALGNNPSLSPAQIYGTDQNNQSNFSNRAAGQRTSGFKLATNSDNSLGSYQAIPKATQGAQLTGQKASGLEANHFVARSRLSHSSQK